MRFHDVCGLSDRQPEEPAPADTGGVYADSDDTLGLNELIGDKQPKKVLANGNLRVYEIGQVVKDESRNRFRSNSRQNSAIYPVGYLSARLYASYFYPGRTVWHLCSIERKDDAPQFTVHVLDDRNRPIVGTDLNQCCKKLYHRHGNKKPGLRALRFFGPASDNTYKWVKEQIQAQDQDEPLLIRLPLPPQDGLDSEPMSEDTLDNNEEQPSGHDDEQLPQEQDNPRKRRRSGDGDGPPRRKRVGARNVSHRSEIPPEQPTAEVAAHVPGLCSMVACNQEVAEEAKHDLLHCATCPNTAHPSCADVNNDVVKVIRSYPWQCLDCKACTRCRSLLDEEDLIICSHCDRGYHTYCNDPPLPAVPEGDWKCPMCEENVAEDNPVMQEVWKAKDKEMPEISSPCLSALVTVGWTWLGFRGCVIVKQT